MLIDDTRPVWEPESLAPSRHSEARKRASTLRRLEGSPYHTKPLQPRLVGILTRTPRPCSCSGCQDKGRRAWRAARAPQPNMED
jgi:hypothetical protein